MHQAHAATAGGGGRRVDDDGRAAWADATGDDDVSHHTLTICEKVAFIPVAPKLSTNPRCQYGPRVAESVRPVSATDSLVSVRVRVTDVAVSAIENGTAWGIDVPEATASRGVKLLIVIDVAPTAAAVAIVAI